MKTFAFIITSVLNIFCITTERSNYLVSADQLVTDKDKKVHRLAVRRAQSPQGNALFTKLSNVTESTQLGIDSQSTWEPPLCGDCWCIPSYGSNCPKKIPKYQFSAKEISFFQNLTLTSGDLTCYPPKPAPWIPDQFWPSNVNSCDVAKFTGGKYAVCAFLYDTPKKKKSCPTSYSLKTYDTKKLAQASGAFVTHTGPCGMCSDAKDLAVYMSKPDLTTEVTACIKLSGFPVVMQCLTQNVGFTPGCALVYLEDFINTNFYPSPLNPKCPALCQVPAPPNGPPPDCAINSCLACNEEASMAAGKAGNLPMDFFTTYAGRTRRNSGLLSNIVRQCDSIATDVKQKYCPSL